MNFSPEVYCQKFSALIMPVCSYLVQNRQSPRKSLTKERLSRNIIAGVLQGNRHRHKKLARSFKIAVGDRLR